MTIDSFTDTVFFSDLLPARCPELYKSIKAILDENKIEHRLLQRTPSPAKHQGHLVSRLYAHSGQ